MVSLGEAEFSIGRVPSNHLAIADPLLSKQHCVIRKEAGSFTIRDLDSHNCTFVNDVPVKEQRLVEGDRIRLGKSLFVFLLEETTAAAKEPVVLEEDEIDADNTVTLRVESALPEMGRVARDLTAVFKISAVINSLRSLDALERKLLELIFEVVPAESGAILLVGDGPDRYSSIAGWDRRSGSDRPVSVSHSVVRRALRERAVVLVNDVLKASGLDPEHSLIVSHIESVLCVPLLVFEETLGAVYLQTTDRNSRFGEEHVHFMSAIAPIAAVALKNVLRMEQLERENQLLRSDIDIKHEMVGESAALGQVHRFIARAVSSRSDIDARSWTVPSSTSPSRSTSVTRRHSATAPSC